MLDVFAESGLDARGSNAIATMISQVISEYFAMHPEVSMGPAEGALGFRHRKAHGAQKAQSTILPRSGSHIPPPLIPIMCPDAEPITGARSLVNHDFAA